MIKPTGDVKELRKFAVSLFFALGILGIVLVKREYHTGIILWGLGSAVLLIAWVQPKALRRAHQYWMKLALMLGLISSHVILALLYYFVFTPVGILMRLFGRDPLQRRTDPSKGSYWITKTPQEHMREQYEKMY